MAVSASAIASAVAPAALQAGGSIWSAVSGYNSTIEANRTAKDLASTSIQRRKADLIAAGMNPLLAVNDGAESPAMQVWHPENPAADPINAWQRSREYLLQQMSTEANLKKVESEIKTQASQQAVNSAMAAKIVAETALPPQMISESNARIDQAKASAGLSSAQTSQINADIHKRQFYGELWESAHSILRSIKNWLGPILGQAGNYDEGYDKPWDGVIRKGFKAGAKALIER